MELDKTDFKILAKLQDNGKSSYSEIARVINVSEGTVRARINKMLKEEVFEFIIHMNPNKIGLHVQAIIGLETKLGLQDHIACQLKTHQSVRFIGAFSGKHDLIIQGYFRDNEELVSFVNEQLAKIEGIISVDVNVELKQYKDTFSYIDT
ncbi:Lrp/AsnC family transcriptional regulator for asnA, asnC and gidA [Geomicrobium halophilum]|uniref:Lrp/AsnC family transcriptional regulator for asnA, asnC and gidA n=1 Tax=Geomicrobium halophilum TaxID=549000 RepID=A0A841PW40_9BACL|nr:Lrp/AsnC family transcriptional regulator [Geomicrobium halophilum]MBB6450611.1 Lrp/AsnC family transcriptional regulator for asnA, asnC and gidA [Geomicrobium halophilum]